MAILSIELADNHFGYDCSARLTENDEIRAGGYRFQIDNGQLVAQRHIRRYFAATRVKDLKLLDSRTG